MPLSTQKPTPGYTSGRGPQGIQKTLNVIIAMNREAFGATMPNDAAALVTFERLRSLAIDLDGAMDVPLADRRADPDDPRTIGIAHLRQIGNGANTGGPPTRK